MTRWFITASTTLRASRTPRAETGSLSKSVWSSTRRGRSRRSGRRNTTTTTRGSTASSATSSAASSTNASPTRRGPSCGSTRRRSTESDHRSTVHTPNTKQRTSVVPGLPLNISITTERQPFPEGVRQVSEGLVFVLFYQRGRENSCLLCWSLKGFCFRAALGNVAFWQLHMPARREQFEMCRLTHTAGLCLVQVV